MSGGSLGYFYSELEEHVGDFGDKELDDLVHDLSELFHAREWYLSNDTGVGQWNEALDEFKKKWFSEHGRQERIEKYLDDIRNEVLSSFGIENRYCKNCKHWTPENENHASMDEKGSRYGDCDFEDSCLMHRSESCDKFEKRRTS